MEYYEHPHVKTLKAIAENWFFEPDLSSRQSSRTDTPHDARAITRLVSTASWAVQDPYSDTVAQFVKRYRKAQEMKLEKMRNGEIVELFAKFQKDIDKLFFFTQLTREVETYEGSKVTLVRLRVTDKLPEGPWAGTFSRGKDGHLISIFRYSDKGKHLGHDPFEHMLHTLLHEMCHAYLTIVTYQSTIELSKWN
ncbi:hypothetical protein F4825DRAFT_456974 [Nemania diffusa]|nr:hypothetical protein F4825DRAFT_456974 [Nemania diffusa]